MLATVLGMTMLSKEVQPLKGEYPKAVTLLGIVIVSKLVQSWNIYFERAVSLLPAANVTVARLEQPLNTHWPTVLTELGISMLVILLK
jgi:hypothetical protein